MNAAKNFEPFIPAHAQMREFTARAVITGAVLGMIFGASSLYLVLKVGLTVSASIPVAVISLAMFRGLSKVGLRDSSILENNITQTAGSAGESIAFGVGVTMPAILILGFELELTRVMLVGLLGGLLGILMMIPLRRALIVKEHGVLKYPEGTACAAVLKAGANPADRALASPSAQADMRAAEAAGLGKSAGAKVVFTGFFVGLIYKTLNVAFKGWKAEPEKVFGPPLNAGSVGAEISPELLGVGYIIGPRIASIMCAGGVMSFLLLIPMIKFFGEGAAPIPPAGAPIAGMGPYDIYGAYVLYIGAGAVAAGGIFSLIQAMPTIVSGLRGGLGDLGLKRGAAAAGAGGARLDRDLSMKFVGIGIIVLLALIMLAPSLNMNLLGALLIVLFGFIFVTVSSRLTGQIGSSSNPISGMTVATLLFTCLIFLLMGWKGGPYYVTALSVGAIVCIAASNGGTTSQDLKTGFLVGGTPKLQQYAILIGAFCSAIVLGPILLKLNDSATVYVPVAQVAPGGLRTDVSKLPPETQGLVGPQAAQDPGQYRVWHNTEEADGVARKYLVNERGEAVWLVDPGINGVYRRRPDGTEVEKFRAPKATLVSYIIKGILDQKLPWALVLLGVMIAVTLQMSFVPALAFAVGVYLPLAASAPIFIGGMVRWLVDWRMRKKAAYAALSEEQFVAESDKSSGVLLASGYIAGGAIAGILIAFFAGVLSGFTKRVTDWANANNPFFAGEHADALSVIPFAVLAVFLYLVGRETLLRGRKTHEQ